MKVSFFVEEYQTGSNNSQQKYSPTAITHIVCFGFHAYNKNKTFDFNSDKLTPTGQILTKMSYNCM